MLRFAGPRAALFGGAKAVVCGRKGNRMHDAERILMNILWGLIVAVVVGLSVGVGRAAITEDTPVSEIVQDEVTSWKESTS